MRSMTQRQIFYSVILFLLTCFPAAGFLPAQDDQNARDTQNTTETLDELTKDELTELETSLLKQISDLDRSAPDYYAQIRKIGDELTRVESRLQALSNTAGEFPSEPLPSTVPAAGTPSFPEHRNAASEELPSFSPFDGMDSSTLRQLRNDLLSQLKHLNQTIQTLGPQDEALADSLKEQQEELTSNLKQLNAKLGVTANEPPFSAENPAAADKMPVESFSADTVPPDPSTFSTEIPASDPIDTGETWYGSDNKYAKILKEIDELKKAQETTQKQLNEMMDELKTIETQLKLLSRQAVADK